MLTGKDLLAKVKDLGDVSKSDLVRLVDMYPLRKEAENVLTTLHFTKLYLKLKV